MNTAITAVKIPVWQNVGDAQRVDAVAYIVIELPNHEAYPFGKDEMVERVRGWAAEGKLPVRWVDPNLDAEEIE